jgi:hypothetical protein
MVLGIEQSRRLGRAIFDYLVHALRTGDKFRRFESFDAPTGAGEASSGSWWSGLAKWNRPTMDIYLNEFLKCLTWMAEDTTAKTRGNTARW